MMASTVQMVFICGRQVLAVWHPFNVVVPTGQLLWPGMQARAG